MKAVFFNNCDREQIKKLSDYLSRTFKVDEDNVLGNYIIYVEDEKYDEALKVGQEYIKVNNLNIGTINFYGERRPLYATSLVYAEVKNVIDFEESEWTYEDMYSRLAKKVLNELSALLGVDVYCYTNTSDAAVEFLCYAPSDNQEEYAKKTMEYLKKMKNKYFKKFMMMESNGKLIQEKIVEKKENPMIFFFKNSLFFEGLTYPMGSNIAPKSDDDTLKTGYYVSSRGVGVENYDYNEKCIQDGIDVDGVFNLYEKNTYHEYWDNHIKKSYSIPKTSITKLDKVTFMTNIKEENDVLVVTTTFTDERQFRRDASKFKGNIKFEGVRDAMLVMPDGEVSYQDTIKEYFVKIADGKKLLHYSDYSNFFEIFDISTEFSFENPVVVSDYPKVFDDHDYDREDPILAEVSKYIDINVKKLNKVN